MVDHSIVTDNENPAQDVNSTLAVPPPDCIPPSKPPDPPAPDQGTADHHEFDFKWGSFDGKSFTKKMNLCYEQIVYWKKNLFLLPKGAAGKQYIREITRLINAWVEDSPLKPVSMKAIMVMPALLLQKPNKKSKSKDHKMALERRMQQWEDGKILELLKEGKTIQDRLKTPKDLKNSIKATSQTFIERMSQGNVNGAIKLLSDNMVDGIVPLNEDS